MKHLSISILLLFYSFLSYGQSQNWKQIEAPINNSIEIIYQSSQGILIGYYLESNELFSSLDEGLTWKKINTSHFNNAYNNNFIFREDKNKNIYLSMEYFEVIYKIKSTLDDIEPIISNFSSIQDFNFLNNGNLIVANLNFLKVFDTQNSYSELYSHSWWTHSAKILPSKIGTNNYVTNSLGASYTIIEFNDDLTFIGNNKNFKDFYGGICRVNDRIFIGGSYTDNVGISWKTIKDFEYSNCFIDYNDNIYLLSNNKIKKSIDKGNTFNLIDLPFYGRNIFYNKQNQFIVTNIQCYENDIKLSKDDGLTWSEIIGHKNIPICQNLTTGFNENLLSTTCDIKIKKDVNSNWETGVNFYSTLGLEDGSFIGLSSNYEIDKSFDKGLNWSKLSDINSSIFRGQFIKKGNIIYLNEDYIYYLSYSTNSGKDWESVTIPDSIYYYFIDNKIKFTSKKSFYALDKNFSFNEINLFYYNIENRSIIKTTLPSDLKSFDIQTNYYDETLYMLSYNYDFSTKKYEIFLNISNDKGLTFTKKQIRNNVSDNYLNNIETDHNGNIYVFDNKNILMSTDEGESWTDISPLGFDIISINKLQVSYDNYIYLATTGAGILKYKTQLTAPKRLIVNAYEDTNQNCKVDANEPTIKSIKIDAGNSYIKETDSNGSSLFFVTKDKYDISTIHNKDLYEACATIYLADFSNGDDTITVNIPLKVKKRCADPKLSFSTHFLRRCFSNHYTGVITNLGNEIALNTNINLSFDTSLIFENSSLTILSQSSNTVSLNAGSILPGEKKYFTITLKVSCEAQIGQEHCVKGIIKSDNMCYSQVEYTDCQKNIGSFDPNDKSIYVNGTRGKMNVQKGDKIEYLIRFQNTGTDTAFNIKVEDPIASTFNIRSIRPLSSSHPFTWSIQNHKLIVQFSNINLVDSFNNEALSHGFVKFEIQVDSVTQIGQKIENEAFIYFDFNDAIITNKVINTFGFPDFTQEIPISELKVFPNPSNNVIFIQDDDWNENSEITLRDNLGKLLLTQNEKVIQLKQLPNGVYYIQLKNLKNTKIAKIVKY